MALLSDSWHKQRRSGRSLLISSKLVTKCPRLYVSTNGRAHGMTVWMEWYLWRTPAGCGGGTRSLRWNGKKGGQTAAA